jgi:hypothetical protein
VIRGSGGRSFLHSEIIHPLGDWTYLILRQNLFTITRHTNRHSSTKQPRPIPPVSSDTHKKMDFFKHPKKSVDTHTQDDKSLRHMSSNQAEAEVGHASVAVAPEAGLSFGNVLKGQSAHALTPFERKAALINAELDKFGMGRYQWCIWFLCGFGYFLDLAWSQGVGLVASAIYQEMDVLPARKGDIFACANAGLAIGAFTFGILVDVIGRRWAFNLTCLITSIFGLILVRFPYI